MIRRSNRGLRRALLLLFCGLLLAAQHQTRLHALSHLEAHAQQQQQPLPHHEAGPGCLSCLACAAAAHLAPDAAGAMLTPARGEALAARAQTPDAAARAPHCTRNRGPPARA